MTTIRTLIRANLDRVKGLLSQTDKAIAAARRRLLDAVKTVEEGGSPRGAYASYYDIRAIEGVLPPDTQWLEALKDQMYPPAHHSSQPVLQAVSAPRRGAQSNQTKGIPWKVRSRSPCFSK